MRVIVIGAGEVGGSIAADLDEHHEVIVVDRDPERVEELTYQLDVLAVEGDGTSLSMLEEVDVAAADMVIASTDVDETNIVTCATVRAVAQTFTVARVKNTEHLRTWRRSRRAFGVDLMVCTNLLAAEEIVRITGLPPARDVESFAGGLVRMAELEVEAGSPMAGQTVREADRFESLTFAALFRNGDVEIPRGDTEIRPGDRVVVIGTPESIDAFAGSLNPSESGGTEEVVVVGGTEIGYHVARLLGESGVGSRLIEQDPERARYLAEQLPETVVLEHDATDVDFLEREHVGEADVVVAALASEERNLLVSLLADRLGADRTVAVIDSIAYVDLFETVGVDVGVSPREVVAEEISRLTRDGRAENVALIESGLTEVIEVEITDDSALVDRPIRESVPDLPGDVVVGALTRDGDVVVPRGDTVVESGDHVVAFVDAEDVESVSATL